MAQVSIKGHTNRNTFFLITQLNAYFLQDKINFELYTIYCEINTKIMYKKLDLANFADVFTRRSCYFNLVFKRCIRLIIEGSPYKMLKLSNFN